MTNMNNIKQITHKYKPKIFTWFGTPTSYSTVRVLAVIPLYFFLARHLLKVEKPLTILVHTRKTKQNTKTQINII